MVAVIKSIYSLPTASGLATTEENELERIVRSMGDVDFWADPAERAEPFVNFSLLDRVGSREIKPHGNIHPTPTILNGFAAVQGYEGASCMRVDYQVAPGYFFACAVRTGATIGTSDGIITSTDQSNTDGRLFAGLRNGSQFGILHGSTNAVSTPVNSILPATDYVLWGNFNPDNLDVSSTTPTVELGINSPSVLTTGRVPRLHMGDTSSCIFGGVSDRGGGHVYLDVLIVPEPLNGAANYQRRGIILDYLAWKIGKTLTA